MHLLPPTPGAKNSSVDAERKKFIRRPPFFSRRCLTLPLSPGENCPKIFSCRHLFLSRRHHMPPISPKSKSPPLTSPAQLTPTQQGAAPSLRPTRAGVAAQQAPPPTPHAYSSSRHRPSEGATPLAPPPVAVTPLPPLHAPLPKVGAPWLLVGRLEQADSNQ